MIDKFESHTSNLTSPAAAGAIVTPDDTTRLPMVSRALYVGTGGNLRLQLVDQPEGETVTLENVQAGVFYPLRVAKVLSTGTTAGAIVAVW